MAKRRATYEDRIVTDPEIMVGKPVVKGTRIPVELVLTVLVSTCSHPPTNVTQAPPAKALNC